MDNFQKKKYDYVIEISKLVLSKGIAYCSLKKMAEAASTSDRMLMHYFKDKDEILSLSLNVISQEMIQLLSNAEQQAMTFDALVGLLSVSVQNGALKPYLNLWFELISLAGGKLEPYHSIANAIGSSYWDWILSVYEPKAGEDKEAMTALLFTFTEGLVMLDKMGLNEQSELAVQTMLTLYRQTATEGA